MRGGSEFDFLAGRADVARLAVPAVGGQLEWAVGFVAKEGSGFAAPVATNCVGIPECRIGEQGLHGVVALARRQIVASEDPGRCGADCLS
jgi:hypothetical protein